MLEVRIEIPRGSFLKRGSNGRVDFVSPLPCPYNYGSVPGWLGLEGDLLDAVVLGPRLARNRRVRVVAVGAVGLTDRGLYDDKLICTTTPLTRSGAGSCASSASTPGARAGSIACAASAGPTPAKAGRTPARPWPGRARCGRDSRAAGRRRSDRVAPPRAQGPQRYR